MFTVIARTARRGLTLLRRPALPAPVRGPEPASASAVEHAAWGRDALRRLDATDALHELGVLVRAHCPQARLVALGFSTNGRHRRIEAVLLDGAGKEVLDLGLWWRDGGPGGELAERISCALDPWSMLPLYRDRSAQVERPSQVDQLVVTFDVGELAGRAVEGARADQLRAEALGHLETAAHLLREEIAAA